MDRKHRVRDKDDTKHIDRDDDDKKHGNENGRKQRGKDDNDKSATIGMMMTRNTDIYMWRMRRN